MAEIKIPCAAVGSKTEQLIRDAVEVTRENNELEENTERQIFSNTSQLERGTNKFNASLYKSLMNYGASKKHFPYGAWKPSTEELLEIFNRAYHIATMAINTEVPLDRWDDFWDMASIWVELDEETAAWEGESHQRNLPALYAIYAMVHAIVDMEKDKSEFIEDFLYTIRTDEDINEAMEFFLLADKQSLLPPPSSSLDKTDTDTNDDNTNNPEQNIEKKREKAIKAIGKVIKENFGDNQKTFQPAQWSAIYEVYKKEVEDITAKDFVSLMTERGINEGSMASAISRGGRIILHLGNDPRKWVELRETEKKESRKRQIDVALRLIELLDDPSI